jgi:cysteine desulfuration protein SufE
MVLDEFLSELSLFEDRNDRIQALIGIADQYRPAPDAVAPRPLDEAHRVKGCESEVFVWAVNSPKGLEFEYVVDNPQGISAMAMAAILKKHLDHQPLEAVLEVPDDVVYSIFGRELSMGKSMGLIGMVQMTKAEARRAASL